MIPHGVILNRNDYTRAAVVSQPSLFLCDINSLIKEVREYMYVKNVRPPLRARLIRKGKIYPTV